MSTDPIADLRRDYRAHSLDLETVADDPLVQFRTWFTEAQDAAVLDANAMTLATVSPAGRPAARIVLLKGVDERGFVFYTNYQSRKGQELLASPVACLVFWWPELERQVRIDGTVEPVTAAEADTYFESRPRGSQIGAWASRQSEPIDTRAELEASIREVEERFTGQAIPRPPHWSGFRVLPEMIEFWQGRASRLHDRILYQRAPEGIWRRERRQP